MQLEHVLWKIAFIARAVLSQGARCERIGAGGAAQPEVDPPRIERLQRAEMFGDDQRGVVGQHDAACSDPDRLGRSGDVPDQHAGRRTADPAHIVVLGQPVAVIAQFFGAAGLVAHQAERFCRVAVLADRGEIEDRERYHQALYRTGGGRWHCSSVRLENSQLGMRFCRIRSASI